MDLHTHITIKELLSVSQHNNDTAFLTGILHKQSLCDATIVYDATIESMIVMLQ